MKKAKLIDDIRADLRPSRTGFAPWYEQIGPEARAEVEEVKREFWAGKLDAKAYTLARVISKKLAERGLVQVAPQTVSRWLRNTHQ